MSRTTAESVAIGEDRLEALALASDGFPRRVQQRGAEYAARGRVGRITRDGSDLHAVVRGTLPYDVSWHFDGGGYAPSCTCPVGPWCKHAYALADVVLLAAETGSEIEADFEDGVVIAPWPPAPTRRMPAAAALDRLRRSPSAWEREQAIVALLDGTGITSWTLPGGLPAVAMEADPDVRCWRLARAVHTAAPAAVPPLLKPYLERSDVGERITRVERAALAGALATWARAIKPRADRSLRLELHLRERQYGGATLFPVARLTSSRIDDLPRTIQQLQQLRNDLRRNPAALPPDAVALVAALIDHGVGGVDQEHHFNYGDAYASSVQRLLGRVAGSPLVTWGRPHRPRSGRAAASSPACRCASTRRRSASSRPAWRETASRGSSWWRCGPTDAVEGSARSSSSGRATTAGAGSS